MDKKKRKDDNEGFGFYLNHEGIKPSIGLGGGIHIDSDGLHFGGLKLF